MKSTKIKHAQKNEEISLERNEKGIFLVLKNIEKPPYFVPQYKNKKVVEKENDKGLKSDKEKVGDELNNNYIDNLVALSNLFKDGLITEEEYQKEKKKILG